MEPSRSFGLSWADQWDSDPLPAGRKESSTTAKAKDKVGQGLGQTKAAVSSGAKKLKDGTAQGLHWIKAKYQKTTQKH